MRRRTGRAGSIVLRVRTRRRPGSASLSWPERRRLSDCTANGSGIPPDGDVFGLSEMRSLPPPPESSSSSWVHVDALSDRRNMRNSAPPSTRATRWRTPKITSSSASGDIAQGIPPTASGQTPFRYHPRPLVALITPARGDQPDHGRLHEALTYRPLARGLALD